MPQKRTLCFSCLNNACWTNSKVSNRSYSEALACQGSTGGRKGNQTLSKISLAIFFHLGLFIHQYNGRERSHTNKISKNQVFALLPKNIDLAPKPIALHRLKWQELAVCNRAQYTHTPKEKFEIPPCEICVP